MSVLAYENYPHRHQYQLQQQHRQQQRFFSSSSSSLFDLPWHLWSRILDHCNMFDLMNLSAASGCCQHLVNEYCSHQTHLKITFNRQYLFDWSNSMKMINYLSKFHLASVTHLSFSVFRYQDNVSENVKNLIHCLPALQELEFNELPLENINWSELQFQLSKLTSLKLVRVRMPNNCLLNLLSQCKSLKSFYFIDENYGELLNNQNNIRDIVHCLPLTLTSLNLFLRVDCQFDFAIDRFPCLQQLTLCPNHSMRQFHDDNNKSLHYFMQQIQRVNLIGLKKLTLNLFSTNIFLNYLQQCNLHELYLDIRISSSEALQLIVDKNPNLQKLTLIRSDLQQVNLLPLFYLESLTLIEGHYRASEKSCIVLPPNLISFWIYSCRMNNDSLLDMMQQTGSLQTLRLTNSFNLTLTVFHQINEIMVERNRKLHVIHERTPCLVGLQKSFFSNLVIHHNSV